MADTHLLKQTVGKPLFPDLLWSRPENKQHAGKLLVIGGNQHGFGAPGEAYTAATSAGIGNLRVLLPDNVKKLVPKEMHLEIVFLPSVKNGSFSKQAVGELVEQAEWADVTLLAGSLGRNSETAATIERVVSELKGSLVVTEDALDLLAGTTLVERPQTLLVCALGQLQRHWPHAFDIEVPKNSDTLIQFAEKLSHITNKLPIGITTMHNQQLLVAHDGMVSATQCLDTVWRVKTAAKAATWWAWAPNTLFEAVTSSLIYN